jgi:nucleoside phosphorylase
MRIVGDDTPTLGRVFLSYARENSGEVDRLAELLKGAGLDVWRDSADLWPGQDWRREIRKAITSQAFVFIACFSSRSVAKKTDFQNEELTLAIEEIRKRQEGEPWLIPVRFDECQIPDRTIDSNRTLRSLTSIDLFGPQADASARRLIETIRRMLAQNSPEAETATVQERSLPLLPGEPSFGIVTALPEEFVAMRELIDDPRQRNIAGDRADYVLGTIPSRNPARPHPVVLTLLAETGNDAASSGCANLLRSFPSVRCLLMAGIAAGVPNVKDPPRHVRLGDIVAARWGIVEYDSVTETARGPVPRRTFPPASPLLERRARMLDAKELLGQRPWEEWITLGTAKLTDFTRPPASTDVLYAGDETDIRLPHPDIALTGHRPGWPKVHCGMIASGDRSLRSARRRNEIAESSPDVRAIEMEGKGIGNTGFSEGVEYLVIRGVSDYGDSHVNPAWRKYAALIAAAYTRALLAECVPLEASGTAGQSTDLTTLDFLIAGLPQFIV